MSQKIKSFWLKMGAMFLTLYFMPLANFIRGVFGLAPAGNAYAGTVTCGDAGPHECGGVSNKTIQSSEYVQCTCTTDSSKVYDLLCQEAYDDSIGDMRQYWRVGSCYVPGACSPNGKVEDCSTSSRNGTKKCVNGKWGACEYGECKSGYVLVGNSCLTACRIDNGTGYNTYVEESSSSSSTEA